VTVRTHAIALAVGVSLACARLPDFAAPKRMEGDSASVREPGDSIAYRALKRGDFKRATPPGQVKHGEYELGALTCGLILTTPDTQFEIQQTTEPNGSVHYGARFKTLRFRALMDRQCSWWNPANKQPEYTLEHEQIHFALHEIEARRLNAKAAQLVQETEVTGKSRDAVVAEMNERMQALLEEHAQIALERNEDFDEETSLGHKPEQQKRWFRTIQRELAETEKYK
jgi:hypothetical protein